MSVCNYLLAIVSFFCKSYCLLLCVVSYSEDSYPGSSIDLKCKERVTDSDSENGSGDEGERKVSSHTFYIGRC